MRLPKSGTSWVPVSPGAAPVTQHEEEKPPARQPQQTASPQLPARETPCWALCKVCVARIIWILTKTRGRRYILTPISQCARNTNMEQVGLCFCLSFTSCCCYVFTSSYYRLGCLKQHRFITLQIWKSEVQVVLKSRYRQACGVALRKNILGFLVSRCFSLMHHFYSGFGLHLSYPRTFVMTSSAPGSSEITSPKSAD